MENKLLLRGGKGTRKFGNFFFFKLFPFFFSHARAVAGFPTSWTGSDLFGPLSQVTVVCAAKHQRVQTRLLLLPERDRGTKIGFLRLQRYLSVGLLIDLPRLLFTALADEPTRRSHPTHSEREREREFINNL